MKIQKRIALFLSVMLIALSVLTGCGGKKQESAPKRQPPKKRFPKLRRLFRPMPGPMNSSAYWACHWRITR